MKREFKFWYPDFCSFLFFKADWTMHYIPLAYTNTVRCGYRRLRG